MRTSAVENGGGWVLNGTKAFTTNIHRAHACVVMAVTDPGHDNRSISAFVVEKGTPGFRAGRKENKMGMRASDTGEAIFEDCRIPAGNLIGRRGHGFIDTLKVLDSGRASIAALGVGLAQGAYEAALKYAHERKQFDRPIYDFQAIQHKLTDMAMEIEAARLLTYQAAWMVDQGMRVTKQAAMAKLFSSEAAVRIANEALQVHGGYGFIKDYPVEKYYRDAKLLTIGEGTSEIQRLVIARQIILKH
jgi:alkylation response protein AidB-like acyl-CoA dehydrogenase